MTINTEKLRSKGIDVVCFEISTVEVSLTIAQALSRNKFSSDDAQPFSLTITGHDDREKKVVVLGRVDAVLHKNTGILRLGENLKSSNSVVFIYTLFVETDFSGCGIATYVLEQLHTWVKQKLGYEVDALLLSPVPQFKNEEGIIVQVPMGVEYFILLMKLISFYTERGFNSCDDLLIMAKQINSEGVKKPGF